MPWGPHRHQGDLEDRTPDADHPAERPAEGLAEPAAEPPAGPRVEPTAAAGRRTHLPGAAVACAALAVLVVAAAFGARIVMGGLPDLNPFKGGIVHPRTVDRSGPAVLKAINDLGTLQTASGYYEIVIDVEHGIDHVPSFLAGRRVLFVAAGTVDAGVDVRDLGADAVTVSADRTAATVRLPRPRLSEPHLDLNRSYVYNEERGLVDRIGDAVGGSADDRKALYQLASRRLGEAGASGGELTARAETNARAVVQGLLRPLGFTDVTVTFQP